MWLESQLASLLNITLPLIQAPMAGDATTPELVAAAANAGALGSLAAGYMQPDVIRQSIRRVRQLTSKPFVVNLFVPNAHHATLQQIEHAREAVEHCCPELKWAVPMIEPPYSPSFEAQMQILLDEDIPIFSFTFGIPDSIWIEKCKAKGVILIGTATTPIEAQYLQDKGIDIIAVQGSEAGGHRGSFLGDTELIPLSSLLSSLTHIQVPLVASGGIMNAEHIVQALSLGAEGVQMGSAFLCCVETGIAPHYKNILLGSLNDNTVLTRAFSGKLARGINNKFIQRMQYYEKDILDYPIQHALTSGMRKEASKQGLTDFMSLWAGQNAYLCKPLPVSTLIQEINTEVLELL